MRKALTLPRPHALRRMETLSLTTLERSSMMTLIEGTLKGKNSCPETGIAHAGFGRYTSYTISISVIVMTVCSHRQRNQGLRRHADSRGLINATPRHEPKFAAAGPAGAHLLAQKARAGQCIASCRSSRFSQFSCIWSVCMQPHPATKSSSHANRLPRSRPICCLQPLSSSKNTASFCEVRRSASQ